MAVALRMDEWVADCMHPNREVLTMIEDKIRDINLSLGFELIQRCIEDPALAEKIPDGVTVIHILEAGFPSADVFNNFNRELGRKAAEKGEATLEIHWSSD